MFFILSCTLSQDPIQIGDIGGSPGEQLRLEMELIALIKPLISKEHFALPGLGAKKTSGETLMGETAKSNTRD